MPTHPNHDPDAQPVIELTGVYPVFVETIRFEAPACSSNGLPAHSTPAR